MEDIYGDLENYNDVNEIEELRNENKELKLKLEEQSSKINNLQKELDWVKSNYETMSKNFSSLLKTARAEVERKTQLITNLNLEKDKWVLNFTNRNNNNIIRNIAQKEILNNGKLNNKDSPELKQQDFDMDKNEESYTPSVDTVSSVNTNESDKIAHTDSKPAKADVYSDQNSESKENVTTVSSRPLGIRNRRKSMPVLNLFTKFSSDEEFEELYSAEDPRKKDGPSRRVFERNHNDKKSHKISETSGIDEKYSSYHESSRETCYKSKSTRHSDKYRGKEIASLLLRHRRHFSPEKLHRRPARDHSDERYPRSDYGRHRVLESPPLGKYDYQRRNRERPSKYERAYDERPRFRREKYAFKHKIQPDYDEPSSKRFRSNSYKRHEEEDKILHKEKQFKIQANAVSITEDLGHSSCQSPDYVYTEVISTQPVKEIMNTADTQLEDPRLTSKKYITKKKDNKVTLSSVTGRNVDLKVIHISEWDVQRVDVPEALQRPPEIIDEYVDEVYMRIDNPTSNLSMESGEIYSESNTPGADFVTESVFNDYEDKRNNRKTAFSENIDVNSIQTQVENPQKTSKYKIPKIKKPEDSASRSRADLVGISREDIKLSDEGNKNNFPEHIKKNKSSDTAKSSSRVDVESLIKRDNVNLHNIRDDKQAETSRAHPLRDKRTISVREIVENDDSKIKIPEDSSSQSRADLVGISGEDIKLSDEGNKNNFQEHIKKNKSSDTAKSSSRVDVESLINCDNVNLRTIRDDKQAETSRAHPLRDKRTISVREIIGNDDSKIKNPEDSSSQSRAAPGGLLCGDIKLSDESNKNNFQEDIVKNKSCDTAKSISMVDVESHINCDNVNLHNIRDDKQAETSRAHPLRDKRTISVREIVGNDDSKIKIPEDSSSQSRADLVGISREDIKLSDEGNKNNFQEHIKKNKSSDTAKSSSRVDVESLINCDNVNLRTIKDDKQGKTSRAHSLRDKRTLSVREIVGNDDFKIKKPEDSSSQSRADPVSILCGDIKLSVESNKNHHQADIKKNKSSGTDISTSRVDVESRINCDNVSLHDKKDDKQGKTSRAHRLKDKRKLSVREIVANDLELSDENDDRETQQIRNVKTEVKSSNRTKKNKSPDTEVQPEHQGQIEIGTESLPDDTKQHRIYKINNKETVEDLPSTSNKKHKTKKSHKHKEPSKVVDSKEVSNSKTILEKVNEITPAEFKVKFSDLFGECSSLITPEDLGLSGAQVQTQTNNYIPIFEDAQDAIDVNVEKLDTIQTKLSNIEGNDAVVGDTCANNNIKDKQSETRKVNKLTIKLKKSNNHYEIEPVNSVTAKEIVDSSDNIYSNLNSEADTKEPDVKTMIISTGIQPQSFNYIKLNTVEQVQDTPTNLYDVVTRIQEPLIQALATSTPYKDHYEQLKCVQSDTRLTEASCNSNDSRRERDNVSSAVDQSSSVTNGLESQNDINAPDVRIFVTRRKKRIRKAT